MEQSPIEPAPEGARIGRRLFLGVLGAGAVITVANRPLGRMLSALEDASPASIGGFQIYTVTGSIPHLDPARYRLRVDGLVGRPATLTLSQLASLPQAEVTTTFTCVTGWTVPHTRWAGPRIADLIARCAPSSNAHALVVASADGVYTDSLTLAQAEATGALLATTLDDRPLSADHGAPVRLLVPGMYGYKSVKWVDRITLVAKEEIGYWEQRGYPVDAYIPT